MERRVVVGIKGELEALVMRNLEEDSSTDATDCLLRDDERIRMANILKCNRG